MRIVLEDDHVLAAALTGAADLIATGDKRDLLPLGSYQGIPIVIAKDRKTAGYFATFSAPTYPRVFALTKSTIAVAISSMERLCLGSSK